MTETRFEILPLAKVHGSPLNPRQTYDPKKLEELIASVRAKGVITPLLVRPNAKGFEIAAGHRRYRAAHAAELADVPAVIRTMDDVDFLEVLIMENDEREDLHPLEEAEGYRTLMIRAGYTIERIAERRGCSVKYVYDRVKLLSLIPEAQTLFRANRFSAGHAILLARLKPEDQKRALSVDRDRPGRDGGVFEDEDTLWNADDVVDGQPGKRREKADPYDGFKARSVRELEAWIAEHVRFKASDADPFLFPEAAAAVQAATEAPRKEKVVEITHDSFIQEEARDGRTIRDGYWKRADGQRGSKPCERAVTGVIVVGPGQGDAFKVCVDRERCEVHWGKEIKEKEKRAKSPAKASSSSSSSRDKYEREEARRRAEQATRDALQARWKKATPKILEAIAASVKKAPVKAGGLLAQIVLDAVNPRWGLKAPEDLVPRGKTAEDVLRRAAFIVLANEAANEYQAPETFPKRAKAFGIDVKKIVDEAAPAAKAESSEKKPVQTSAKRKVKR